MCRGYDLETKLSSRNFSITAWQFCFEIYWPLDCSEITKNISWNRFLKCDYKMILVQFGVSQYRSYVCAWYECMNTNSFFFKLNLTLIWQKTNNCVYSYDDTICKLIYVAWFKNNQPYHKRTLKFCFVYEFVRYT